jgi:hypothetical protein
MQTGLHTRCTAFEGARCIAAGELADVALRAKAAVDKGEQVLIFDDATSDAIEVDFRGTPDDVLARPPSDERTPCPLSDAPRPGRRSSVVARESRCCRGIGSGSAPSPAGRQSHCASSWKRRGANAGKDRVRQSQEVAYRFMSAMAGNRHGFEGDAGIVRRAAGAVRRIIEHWHDIRNHAESSRQVRSKLRASPTRACHPATQQEAPEIVIAGERVIRSCDWAVSLQPVSSG